MKRFKEQETPDSLGEPFSPNDLEKAISNLKSKKSPGPDKVTHEMIHHLDHLDKTELLKICNLSWTQGILPLWQEWREAEIIPIHKQGKPLHAKASYRHISLLSCISKTIERMVNNRLLPHLKQNDILNDSQSGYRKIQKHWKSSHTWLNKLEMLSRRKKKQKVFATFFDLSKSFDKAWKGLLCKLSKCVKGKMLNWIRDYLTRRCARDKAKNTISNLVHLHEDVYQGGVLFPMLFLVYINDIPQPFSHYVHRALHANDLEMWTAAETSTVQTRMQDAIIKVEQWAKNWGVTIDESKTASMLSSTSTKPEQFRLVVNGHDISASSIIKYHDVTFDQRLTRSKHLLDISSRATLRMRILKELAGTQWSANLKTLKQVYIGSVRPVLEYDSSGIWNKQRQQHSRS